MDDFCNRVKPLRLINRWRDENTKLDRIALEFCPTRAHYYYYAIRRILICDYGINGKS